MKPRDAVFNALETYIEPKLGLLNFKFLRGSMAFVRNDGQFSQRIETQLSRWNLEDISAVFYTRINVRSNYYVRWYKDQYNKAPANNAVADEFYVNLNGWKHGSPETAHPGNVEQEMLNYFDDLKRAAIPFLEHYSNWSNAAELFVKKRWFHGRACDFYLIGGDRERAYWSLHEALRTWREQPDRSCFLGEREGIQLRFQKHFGETISI